MGQFKHQLYLRCSLRLSLGLLCNDQHWPNVITLILLTFWLSYPNTFGIIHLIMCIIWGWPPSFIGNFNFNRHRSCEHHEIQCHQTPHRKEVNHRPKWRKHASVPGSWTPQNLYIGCIGSKTRRCQETHTRHAGQSHLMRVTWTSTLPKRRHHRS